MIDILLPTLGERDLEPVLENIEETTHHPHTVTVIKEGNSPAQAVNVGFKKTKEPYFIFWNDDFEAQQDWDIRALAKMRNNVQVVAINDGNPGEVQWGTICLVKRSYIEEHGGTENPGEVFHEGYGHWYVDTEFYERATARGMTDTAPDSIIIHRHPAFDETLDTKTYKRPGKSMERDSQLYMERRRQYL